MQSYRTHTCGELRAADIGKTVKLGGWIHRKRNLGNLCFVDLRDHYGITQCVLTAPRICLRLLKVCALNRLSGLKEKWLPAKV